MSKQQFTEALFSDAFKPGAAGVEYFDTCVTKKLSNDVVAKCTISSGQIHNQFDRVVVKIINTNTGVLDTQSFLFDDYLTIDPQSRTDHNSFEVIGHCGWQWYIKTPTKASVNSFAQHIQRYINQFK